MACVSRPLFFLAVCAFPALAVPAGAQVKNSPPAAKPYKPVAGNTAPAAPRFVVPSAENTVILIRSTLLCLNDAMRSGNYTVLRDLAAPSFRDSNTAGRLYQIFADLSAKRIDLSAAAILAPKLPQPPNIDQNNRLHISGYFPGEPVQINFDLVFEAVANQWRLFGISVAPAELASANINPAARTGDKEKRPPQPAKLKK
jgi:hypothetical protein